MPTNEPPRERTTLVQRYELGADIEVLGRAVGSILDGFSLLRHLPSQLLLAEGIGRPDERGLARIDPAAWYPAAAWLRVFERVVERVGPDCLFDIGERIPDNAAFPPWVDDMEGALRSIDTAYHMNHRKGGAVMYDPASGRMLEGIGHYKCTRDPHQSRVVCECDNPYPCRFDHGLITAVARKLEPSAFVAHDDLLPCRARGGRSCTYVVAW